MSLPSTDPIPLKTRRITIPVTIDIPILTCLQCGKEGEFVPNTLNRSTYTTPWKLQGWLYPEGWDQGLCASCAAISKAMGGQ